MAAWNELVAMALIFLLNMFGTRSVTRRLYDDANDESQVEGVGVRNTSSQFIMFFHSLVLHIVLGVTLVPSPSLSSRVQEVVKLGIKVENRQLLEVRQLEQEPRVVRGQEDGLVQLVQWGQCCSGAPSYIYV